MMVTVKLFGTLRLDSGVKEFQAEGASVKALYPAVLKEIREKNPECRVTEKDLRVCLVAVNGVQVRPGTRLRDGDTVYLFPAVAGG